MRSMTRVEAIPYDAMKAGLPWDWVTFPEFLDRVAAQPQSVNLRPFVPGRPAARLGARLRARQGGRDADRRRARRDAPPPARGDGRGRRRLVGAAPPPRRGREHPARLRRHADGDRRHARRDLLRSSPRCSPSATTASSRSPTAAPEGEDGHRFIERLAEISGRPVILNVVLAFDRMPEVHRGQLEWLALVPRARPPGLRPGRHDRRRLHLHLRGLEPVRRERRVVRGHDRDDRGAPGQARRPGAAAGAARRARLHRARPDRGDRRRSARARDETKQWANMTVGDVAAATGKHPVDAMLDIAVADRLATTFFSKPAINTRPRGLPRPDDRRVPAPRRLRRRRAHEVPHRRPLPDRDDRSARCATTRSSSLEQAHWKLSALPGALRRLHRPRHARSRQGGRHRRLRLRPPRHDAGREGARLPGRRVAPRPARRRLPLRPRQRRGHDRGRQGDRSVPPGACCATRSRPADGRRSRDVDASRIITGAGRGMGREHALLLADGGREGRRRRQRRGGRRHRLPTPSSPTAVVDEIRTAGGDGGRVRRRRHDDGRSARRCSTWRWRRSATCTSS